MLMANKNKSSKTTTTYTIKDIFSQEDITLEEILKQIFVKQVQENNAK